MLKATLAAAAAVFLFHFPLLLFLLRLPTASFFSVFFLLTSQLSHIKNANNLLALYGSNPKERERERARPSPSRGLIRPCYRSRPGYPVAPSLPTRRCCSVTTARRANLEAKAQRVKSKRFNIYGTLYGLWAYFKTPSQPPTAPRCPSSTPPSALPVSLPVWRQQQMMLFKQAGTTSYIASRLYFVAYKYV